MFNFIVFAFIFTVHSTLSIISVNRKFIIWGLLAQSVERGADNAKVVSSILT